MDAFAQPRAHQAAVTSADIVIVGGGAAGCVLASRLSEDLSLKVLLIEAGRDTPPDDVPEDVADIFPRSYANPAYFWSLTAIPRPGAATVSFPQARIMGGGSSVMGMWAPRGLPADYDAWKAAGANGWSFADLLPYLKKLEGDRDFPDGAHGSGGPIPITRRARSSWPPFTEALAKAAETRGVKFLPDLNGSDQDGLFELPFSNDGKTRFSSAHAYLTTEVRKRPNLAILPNTEVTRLRIEGRRVVGVVIKSAAGEHQNIAAKHVILAAGAIFSPTLLLKSGIGPASELSPLGIVPVLESPKVGRNLQNHPYVHLGAVVRPGARHDPSMRSYVLGCARLSSNVEGAPRSDLFLGLMSRSGPRPRDIGLGMAAVALYSPFSRGRVTLSDKSGTPKLELGLLEDSRDRTRIVAGARIARELMTDPLVRSVTHETFVLPAKLPIKLLNEPGLKSNLFSISLAAVLDTAGPIRRFVLNRGMGKGRLLDDVKNEAAFEELIISSTTSMAHPAGTCALGAVVDSSTAVIGMDGLFVADASIMPKVPRANTNIATVALAEKAAVEIRARLRS
jgi:5-(hydroxymethyl)furfural/furfural oxidase